MITSPNPTAAEAFMSRVSSQQELQHPRTEGLHVSDLVYCRRKAWYRLHGFEEAPRTIDNQLQLLLGTALGALFEEHFESEVGVTIHLPSADVHGTADLVERGPDGRVTLVGEIKESRSGSNKPVEAMGYYVEQIASYCLGFACEDARLYIAHLLGDYSGPKLPNFRAHDVHFSSDELIDWEAELERRAEQAMAAQKPSCIGTHWVFECSGCGYNIDQGGPCPGGQGYTRGFFTKDAA